MSAPAAPSATRGDIGRQWIKAHVIGGLINIVVTFVAFLIGQAFGVSEKGASVVLQTVFVLLATAALTFGLFVLGYLSGVVLRTKLPAFPMRNWLALHVVLGVIFGVASAVAWLGPENSQDVGAVDTDLVVGLAVGAAVVGVAMGAVIGALQALILRPAAKGLGLWIGSCALAGTLLAMIVPAVVYGPQSGFASELAVELVTLVVTILAAVVLLPALGRLEPR